MRSFKMFQVDAFTTKRFEGNPAAVLLDAESLSVEEMKAIARENKLSETAFVLPSDKAELRLRYYTPGGEDVGFCGHATIASFQVFWSQGLFGLKDGKKEIHIETKLGVLPVRVSGTDDHPEFAIDTPPVALEYQPLSRTLCQAVNLTERDFVPHIPMAFDRINRYLYAVVKDRSVLDRIHINPIHAQQLFPHLVLIGTITLDTVEEKSAFLSRTFDPLGAAGFGEDPFTGSAQIPMATYLVEQGFLKRTEGENLHLRSEQGDPIGRPGRSQLILRKDEQYFWGTIKGQGVEVFETILKI